MGVPPSRCFGLQLQHRLVPGAPARRLAGHGSQFLKTSLHTQAPPGDTCRHRGLSPAWVPLCICGLEAARTTISQEPPPLLRLIQRQPPGVRQVS